MRELLGAQIVQDKEVNTLGFLAPSESCMGKLF